MDLSVSTCLPPLPLPLLLFLQLEIHSQVKGPFEAPTVVSVVFSVESMNETERNLK